MNFSRQTSDTESCEIIHDHRLNTEQTKLSNEQALKTSPVESDLGNRHTNYLGHSFLVRKESLKSSEPDGDIDDNEVVDDIHQNYISDALKYGAGHHSIDSNPIESQSEWSDDEIREEATGELKTRSRPRLSTFQPINSFDLPIL